MVSLYSIVKSSNNDAFIEFGNITKIMNKIIMIRENFFIFSKSDLSPFSEWKNVYKIIINIQINFLFIFGLDLNCYSLYHMPYSDKGGKKWIKYILIKEL